MTSVSSRFLTYRIAPLLLVLTCADGLGAQAYDEGAFILRTGADTFAVENFTRSMDGVTGEITGRAIGRVSYAFSFGPDQTIDELSAEAWTAGTDPEGPPAQVLRIRIEGDTVDASVSVAGVVRTERFPSAAAAVPYLNPSFVLVEHLVRQARSSGMPEGEVDLPVFMTSGGQTVGVRVRQASGDTAIVVFPGIEMRVAVDARGRLRSATVPAQGLTVERYDGLHVPPITTAPPDYGAPADAPYSAEEVVVSTTDGHILAGTLTLPSDVALPGAVVLITGSGAQDRDQSLPLIRGYRPFRQIADLLSRRGFAVLRLDDRGFGGSTGDVEFATTADFADDISAALDYLRDRPDIDARRLGLVGHSEGGMIATMIAATDPDLRGIVLIASPAKTGREIIIDQLSYAIAATPTIPSESRDSMLAAALADVERRASSMPWLDAFLAYDPLPTARSVASVPVLILHGGTDRQVTPDQAPILAEAFSDAGNTDVTVRVFPGVNHLMLADPDGNPAHYGELPGGSLVEEVLVELADWLEARFGEAESGGAPR